MRVVPANLEHVAEIRREFEMNGHHDFLARIVGEGDALVHAVLPQETRALDMHDALRCLPAVRSGQREIGEVGGEEDIVLRQRGAEQRWHPVADEKPETREHPRIVAKEPVAAAPDVAIGVGDDEAILMLERELPMRFARRHLVKRCQSDRGIELTFI